MDAFPGAVGVGVVVFASTNLDDLLVLSAFFADPGYRTRAVVAGQFLGIGLLTLASLAAAWLALAAPEGWVSLLGLVPLGLGLAGLVALRRGQEPAEAPGTIRSRAPRAAGSQTLAVAAVTVANGGDNLGVYIPLFARHPEWIGVWAVLFAALVAVWCALAHRIVRQPLLGERLRRHGHVMLPFVLIALGLYIVSGAGALWR